MKKIAFGIIMMLALFVFQQEVLAQDKTFGLGGSIGDPNGISAKLWIGDDKAIVAGLAFALADEFGFFQVQADFLLHKPIDLNWDAGSLLLHYGGGIGIYSGSRWDTIYLRIPVGLTMNFADAPIDIFIEMAPYADVDPEIYFSFTGAAGFRFYF